MEGHIAIYESVKVILVVGVALSLSFSSPLPPLASHSFVARRSSRPLSSSPSSSTSIWSSSKPSSSSSPSPPHSSSSHVARRGRCRRRPRRYHPLFAIVKLIIRSLFCALLLLLLLLLIFAVHLPPSIVAVAVAARDCFALPSSSLHRLGVCAGVDVIPVHLGGHIRLKATQRCRFSGPTDAVHER